MLNWRFFYLSFAIVVFKELITCLQEKYEIMNVLFLPICLRFLDTIIRLYFSRNLLIQELAICRPERFNSLLQKLQYIEAQKSALQSLISADQLLLKVSANVKEAMSGPYHVDKHHLLGLVDIGSHDSHFSLSSGVSRVACWVPFDVFLENAMDGKLLHAISPLEILTGAS